MSASPTEGTDINQIEKAARAMAEQANDYDADVLQWECWVDSAKAAIAAMQPAPQEPVGSAAEITRLTEALRDAEEREKGLVRLVERAQVNTPDQYVNWHEHARQALAGAKPC